MENLRKLKSENGITLVALAITIIVMMILTMSLTISTKSSIELSKYYNVKDDIIVLKEETQKYYLKYEKLPVGALVSFNIGSLNPKDKNPNDGDKYYEIDESKLGNIQFKSKNSTYLINEQSLTVYCKEGVLLNGERHYTIADDYSGGSFAEDYYTNVELPLISVVTFESNRQDSSVANKGDILTLKILCNYDLTTKPTAKINNTEAVITWNGKIGKATYEVTGNESDGELIPFSISNYALNDRTGKEIKKPSFSEGVRFEKTAIKLSNVNKALSNPAAAMPQEAVVIDGDANKGIVISVNGNEYVWVEVPKNIYIDATYANLTTNPNGANKTDGTVTENTDYIGIKNVLKSYTADYSNPNYEDIWYAVDNGTTITANIETLTAAQKNLSNGCGLNYYEYLTLYNKMLKSVFTYGGFWIGRYEAGISASRTSHSNVTDSTETPRITQNAYPYTYTTCSEAQTLASRLENNISGYTSSLMFGIQWDLTLKFLETKGATQSELKSNSTTWGNYANSIWNITNTIASWSNDYGSNWTLGEKKKESNVSILLTTGASTNFSKMNIYDLAGNVDEWTLEYTSHSSNICAKRGGDYFSYGLYDPAAARNRSDITISDYYLGFRSTLYVNL